ncbi:MAG: carboxypeptidase regulatory-like domain-containing protein, partial [Terriglobales bacterium]
MQRLSCLVPGRVPSAGGLVLALATLASAAPDSGTPPSGSASPTLSPRVSISSRHDTSPPLRDLAPVVTSPDLIKMIPLRPLPKAKPAPKGKTEPGDPVVQGTPGPRATPPPLATFEGIGNVGGFLPPDTNGDIGPNHYVQTVNVSFAVFDRNGNVLYGPANINTLFSGFGGPCQDTNDGDPIALYDHLADRWLISQFALPNFPAGPFYQCIAISQTSDPTGAWHRYQFQASLTKLNDYPHFGVWPDAYYMSVNQFAENTLSYAGAGAFAFERDKMLQGLSAQMLYFDLASVNLAFGGMLPADLDGPGPAAGTPNYFLEMDDDAWGWPTDRLSLWEFHVDWITPANATFGIGGNPNQVLDTAPFDSNLCNYSRNCIPQPGGVPVDAISERLMYRVQYRTFGAYSTLVTNHTVDANGADQAGIRWYELRKTGANWAIHQQGTFAPDSDHRWMGSAALDAAGSLAVGYSVSSSTTFPSVRYAGRLAGDPPGTLPQGEQEIIAGAGYQESGSGRWGDYSMMAVDPADECTFWYTQEYYAAPSSADWHTRVGAFRFDACTTGPSGGLQGTVSEAGTALPLSGVRIQAGGSTTFTDNNGFYQFLVLPPASYNLEASKFGYFPQSANGIAVNAGATTVQSFTLSLRPVTNVQGTVVDASGHGWPLYARVSITELGGSTFFTHPLTGTYTVPLPEGETANFKVVAVSPGYQAAARVVNVPQGGATENFGLLADAARCTAPGYALDLKYFEDFEAGNGGYSVVGNTSWQYGTPTSGPGGAFSGSKAWATNLSGNYNDNEDGYLTSPVIDLSAFAGQTPILVWQQWLQTEAGFDYGSVEASNDGGGSWTAVYGEVSGTEEIQWTQRRAILDPSFAVSGFRVRFRLRSDGFVVAPGFYVDDVGIAVVPQPAPFFSESFSGGSLPAGWSIVDNLNNGQVWRFDNPAGRDNETGGGGPFAILDSDFYGQTGFQDSELRSPSLNLAGMATVFLEFDTDFLLWEGGLAEVADVDVSLNGGASWTNVWRQTSNSRGPRHEVVDLTALAAGLANVRLRFHYYNANWEFWWQVDNVRIYAQPTQTTLACVTRGGGMVVGHVYDAVAQL